MNNNSPLKLFLTGATGYIGGGILREFLSKSWIVTALVRDAEKAKNLEKLGAKLLQGSLTDNDLILKESADHDLIIHSAWDHSKDARDIDLQVVTTLLASAKANSEKKRSHFIYTGGCLTLGEGQEVKDEFSGTETPHIYGAFRVKMEALVLGENGKNSNLQTSVVRPTWVYGSTGGYVSQYIKFVQQEKVVVTLIDKGTNYINFVHVNDLARLYYLIYEKKGTGVFHGTDNVYVTGAELSEGLSKYFNVEIKELDINAANDKYGYFAILGQGINQKLITKRSINELGWQPNYPSFLGSLGKVVSELSN